MAEDFASWVTENELNDDTMKQLREAGFVSLKSVKKLTEKMVQKHFEKSLPFGQYLLLQDAVADVRPPKEKIIVERTSESRGGENAAESAEQPPPAIPGTSAMTPGDVMITETNMAAPGQCKQTAEQTTEAQRRPDVLEKELNYAGLCQLLDIGMRAANNDKTGQQNPVASPGKLVFDPFAYNKPAPGEVKCKHRDIREYIMFTQQYANDKNSNIKIGEYELSLCEKKIPLEKITKLQWMEGSLKILKEMVSKDDANMTTVMDYISYLTKIVCMGQSFSWGTVLKYDTEYRKSQAAMGFQWGADSPFLMQLLLRPGTDSTERQKASSGSAGSRSRPVKYDPATGRPTCDRFNGRSGCTLRSCRYAHVCSSCFAGGHSEFSHKNQQQAKPPTVTGTSQRTSAGTPGQF